MAENFAATKIGDDWVCRKCLTMVEEVTAQRGITPTITYDEAEGGDYTCGRCENKISG